MNTTSNINNFKVTIGNVSVSANNIMSFTLKEECSDLIPEKNSYIIKVNGIEMNNITTIDKITIEDGVLQFNIDLNPIQNVLSTGNGNTLQVEGTSNMLVTGTVSLDGFYSLTCGTDYLSIYSTNGLYLQTDTLNRGAVGFYSRRAVDSDTVVYEKFSNGDKFSIFYHPSSQRWYLKHNLSNGVNVNKLLYQQCSNGSADEVPLKDWCLYPKVCGRNNNAGISLCVCIPFESTPLLLVNCGGIDEVNGSYYHDDVNNRFVNVRNSNYVMTYVVDSVTGDATWQIQSLCVTFRDCDGNETEDSPDCSNPDVLYVNRVASGSDGSCIPCCNWEKACNSSPGNPPQVTPLEYYNPDAPSQTIRYFDNGTGTWTLYEGNDIMATGISHHYLVVRAGSVDPAINGAYVMTGVIPPDNNPVYSFVQNAGSVDVVMNYNSDTNQWEITNNGSVLYFADSDDPTIPPFNGWNRASGVEEPVPLVLSPIVPSCLTWTPVV